MNWLAHLYLAEPSPAFRIGSLLPDLVPMSALEGLPPEFVRGIQQHRRIDAFTDAHPIVRQSMRRVDPQFRRFAGILVDVFYDHILAKEWAAYSSVSLPAFATEIYNSFEHHRNAIPPEAYMRLNQMGNGDLLCSYEHLGGIAAALDRIGSRLNRPVRLSGAVPALEVHYQGFHSDFAAFFPEVRSHAAGTAHQRC